MSSGSESKPGSGSSGAPASSSGPQIRMEPANQPAQPLPSATVIVVRERPERRPNRFELFMVRRADRSSFMGGAHVFPGGRVEDIDLEPEVRTYCDGTDIAIRNLPDMSEETAIGYHLAALRELFEEAGVLLARDSQGQLASFEDAEARLRFGGYRVSAQQFSLPLVMILKEEGLRFDLSCLTPWSWWVTPAEEKKRFDARFFLAIMPSGQEGLHDGQETTQSHWFTPTEAIEQYKAHEIHLVPPTLRTLQELSRFETIEDLLAHARTKKISRIQPRLVMNGETLQILLPGDPEHPADASEAVEGDTRFVMEQGRWWSRKG